MPAERQLSARSIAASRSGMPGDASAVADCSSASRGETGCPVQPQSRSSSRSRSRRRHVPRGSTSNEARQYPGRSRRRAARRQARWSRPSNWPPRPRRVSRRPSDPIGPSQTSPNANSAWPNGPGHPGPSSEESKVTLTGTYCHEQMSKSFCRREAATLGSASVAFFARSGGTLTSGRGSEPPRYASHILRPTDIRFALRGYAACVLRLRRESLSFCNNSFT